MYPILDSSETPGDAQKLRDRYGRNAPLYYMEVVEILHYLKSKQDFVEKKIAKCNNRSIKNEKFVKLIKYKFAVDRSVRNIETLITDDQMFYHCDDVLSLHTMEIANKWRDIIKALTKHYFE